MSEIVQILTRYWGYTKFRPAQEEIIHSVLEGKDTLALLPTGGGKSICYQVPAIAKEGICIVVSPLIALIKDQVDNLQKRKIKAEFVVSGMSYREVDIVLDNCVYGNIKFLYVSPERLQTNLFIERFKKMNVCLIAVDEAHCISQWGYDFRPQYLEIATIREFHPNVPVLAVTATATNEVVLDIQNKLKFQTNHIIKRSFERKNLAYVVLNEENKNQRLLKIIGGVGGSGIVYVRTRKKAVKISEFLIKNNIAAIHYHGGLDNAIRERTQSLWIQNKTRVIVATNAFGMGIDKPDVRFVVHIELPDSIEAYFQEAGRAGRDGKKAYSVMLYADWDKSEIKDRLLTTFPDVEIIQQTYFNLCNYFNLAEGSGKDEVKEFDITDFCQQYKLSRIPCFNALKILENAGYISLSEKFYKPSLAKFLVSNNDLYSFEIGNSTYTPIIQLLLRTYSGMFTNYTKIYENELAKKTKVPVEAIIKYLSSLSKFEILDYILANNNANITFTSPRIAKNAFYIPNEIYSTRKKTSLLRAEAVITYATSTHKCRSQILLAYFGETSSFRCGICDACLERNKLKLSNLEFKQVSDNTKNLLKLKPLSHAELLEKLSDFNEDNILKVLEWLTDNNKIDMDEQGKLSWKKED